MILLDTNKISELMRAEPAQAVLDWFAKHDAAELFISTVTEAELRTGVAILPEGQRRDRLQLAVNAMIDQDLQARIVLFDGPAAKAYAEICAVRLVALSPRLTARSPPSPARPMPPWPPATSRISMAAASA
jgi:predicted nucleic acid-binding protein